MAINEQNLVPYIVSTLRGNQLAIAIATRLNLPGAEDSYTQEFQRLMAAQDIQGATAKLAARISAEEGCSVHRKRSRCSSSCRRSQDNRSRAGVCNTCSLLLEKGKMNRVGVSGEGHARSFQSKAAETC